MRDFRTPDGARNPSACQPNREEPRCSKADADERLEQVRNARQQRKLLLDGSEQSDLCHRFADVVFWCQIEEISEEERFGFPPPSRLLRFL